MPGQVKLRTYDEDGNIIEPDTKKGLKGGECGMLSCTMPNAYWFNKDREFHTCHWCAQDANRLREGTSVNRGLPPNANLTKEFLSTYFDRPYTDGFATYSKTFPWPR